MDTYNLTDVGSLFHLILKMIDFERNPARVVLINLAFKHVLDEIMTQPSTVRIVSPFLSQNTSFETGLFPNGANCSINESERNFNWRIILVTCLFTFTDYFLILLARYTSCLFLI